MSAHRPLAAAALLLLGSAGAADAQLLLMDPAPSAWAPASPSAVLLPGTNQAVVGHGPIILVPSNAPPGHLPGRHHPLVRTWAIPVGAIPVVQAPVAVFPLAMPPGMPSALWPAHPRHSVGPSLPPGAFRTGLDIQQARLLAADTLRHWPGADLEAIYDVGLRSWTVHHRTRQNGADASESGGNGNANSDSNSDGYDNGDGDGKS
jgi:hypothetical protein